VHVSASLTNVKDRNVSIEPLVEGAPRLIVGKTRKPHPHTLQEKLLSLGPVKRVATMLSSPPLPAWQTDANATAACPRPLRLRVLPYNGTHEHPLTQSVSIALIDADGAWDGEPQFDLGIDGVELEGRVADDSDPEDVGVELEFEYEEEEEEAEAEAEAFHVPIGEITSLLAAIATAAASSEFVRMHVKPETYAKQKAREGDKKAAADARSGADMKVKALLAMSVDEIDIEEAKQTIDDAEAAGVLASLIDKALEHTQSAVEAQLMQHGKDGQTDLM